MSGRKQWNKQAATSSFLDKKPPQSLVQQGLEGSTAVGKDEVGSSNLPSSSTKNLETAMVLRFFLFFEIALKYLNLWVLLNILLKIVLNEKMFARSVILRRDLQ